MKKSWIMTKYLKPFIYAIGGDSEVAPELRLLFASLRISIYVPLTKYTFKSSLPGMDITKMLSRIKCSICFAAVGSMNAPGGAWSTAWYGWDDDGYGSVWAVKVWAVTKSRATQTGTKKDPPHLKDPTRMASTV